MRVLFPIDGSLCSWKTLEWAIGFLDSAEYSILLLVVVHPAVGQQQREIEKKEAEKFLYEARELFETNGFTVERAEVLEEYMTADQAGTICKYAGREGVDQIIIGSHGQKGKARFLMGSVSMDVFRKARVPVLVLNNQLSNLEKSQVPDFLG